MNDIRRFLHNEVLAPTDSYHKPAVWLQRAKDILEERFTEQHKLAEIAKEVGVHPVHLSREFRRRFGSSVFEYLRYLRIEYACHQLITSNESPARIASAAGFADQSHFSRTFKRLRGTTPGRYRAAGRSMPTESSNCVSL